MQNIDPSRIYSAPTPLPLMSLTNLHFTHSRKKIHESIVNLNKDIKAILFSFVIRHKTGGQVVDHGHSKKKSNMLPKLIKICIYN